nr:hypothetical protein [Tanacetum cinerariifolium]
MQSLECRPRALSDDGIRAKGQGSMVCVGESGGGSWEMALIVDVWQNYNSSPCLILDSIQLLGIAIIGPLTLYFLLLFAFSTTHTTEYEFDSSDDQSLSDEDFPEEIFSNPLFEEEIISTKIDPHYFDAESDLIESMLNHDLLSFLLLRKLILFSMSLPRLLYDNPSPRPLKKFIFENSNAKIESFSPSPIPVEDSDSFMEEIDLSCTLDDPMPPGIEDDDYDCERDILIYEELLDNYSVSLEKSNKNVNGLRMSTSYQSIFVL